MCESRAGIGRYEGANAAVYRRFRVTGELMASCRSCGVEVRGFVGNLKKHLERCGGIKVAWAVVDMSQHFTAATGGGGGHRCAHCDMVVAGKSHHKRHMAACKSLPQDVREVLDHAAVCESRAEKGRYGRENNRAVYRRFHVTGERVAMCKACGASMRGDTTDLRHHLAKTCVGPAAASTPPCICMYTYSRLGPRRAATPPHRAHRLSRPIAVDVAAAPTESGQ